MTARQVADQIDESYVRVRAALRTSGVLIKGRRQTYPPSATETIVRLHDSGMPMTAVADQVGMSVPGAWSRYRTATRVDKSFGRWQQVLCKALERQPSVSVQSVVTDHVGRTPTRAEMNAARRAAHQLANRGLARLAHANAAPELGGRKVLVLLRPKTKASDVEVRRRVVVAANGGKQSPKNQTRDLERLRTNLTRAAATARTIGINNLPPDEAGQLVGYLQSAIADLTYLVRRAENQMRRRVEFTGPMTQRSRTNAQNTSEPPADVYATEDTN